ncbi:division/cell wall cluster transcriptional repressor MraZ [Nitrosococcus watsonii]|uniref:Transcriptional regulator MraZ n=1 Tax=Nitrosococcus watsoni (strain C-113) TaxID=105559 RepID=D8K8X8_NITWC|nr:division/cell wall cluster transcriptional repressor MraZ [Nitrosococcus watsonii]ADJ27188.1 MraZ protein [Nitrosococcus watsonii C-113]
MFRGITTLNLDAKGRLSIPAKYRKSLGICCESKVVITVDLLESCLQLYPLPEWEAVERKLIALPSHNRQARYIKRQLIGHAEERELDSHGRILLPLELRSRVELGKNITLVGQGNKFELWNAAVWEQQIAKEEALNKEELTRELALLGL